MIFTEEEIIEAINGSDMSIERKNQLLLKVKNGGIIAPGFYLRKNDDNTLECWFRNQDPEGTVYHGPTDYNPKKVVSIYEKHNNR